MDSFPQTRAFLADIGIRSGLDSTEIRKNIQRLKRFDDISLRCLDRRTLRREIEPWLCWREKMRVTPQGRVASPRLVAAPRSRVDEGSPRAERAM